LKKLEDPASSKLQGFNLKKELKLWGPVQEVLLPLYKKVSESMSPSAIDNAFGMIYLADKKFKSSSSEKSVTMTNLIHGLCSLQ
jgi:DNA polymerase III delta subunit